MIVAHGYVSSLMFYYISECYSSVGVRLIYMTNSLYVSSMIYSCSFMLLFIFNAGTPPSLSFFSEVVGVVSVIWFS